MKTCSARPWRSSTRKIIKMVKVMELQTITLNKKKYRSGGDSNHRGVTLTAAMMTVTFAATALASTASLADPMPEALVYGQAQPHQRAQQLSL